MQRLASEQMEVLRGRRAVGDTDVALGAKGEEALEPRARMLGALAFVAVRQQQREPRGLPPFGEPGDQELVDHHLGAVREVAELRLPQNQRVLRLDGVAVLETETGVLGQWTIVELERHLDAGELLDRRVARAAVDVVQHEMPLTERAALGVLPGQTNRRALAEQRRKRERFGVRPFDAILGRERAAPLELL